MVFRREIMISQFCFGKPMETGAIVKEVKASLDKPNYFQLEKFERQAENETVQGYKLTYKLDKKTQIFGLGENVRGINKRGYVYESYCSDDPNHDEGKHSLYGAHNFILVKGKEQFGLFVDFPGRVSFDLGYTQIDQLEITIFGTDFKLYFIEENSVTEIAEAFRSLIGRSYIAPKWAMGYQQSRWGYKNEADIKAVVEGYRKNGLPLDAVYLDIDYMEDFKDFTVDQKAFPDLKGLANKLKEKQGVRLVPIIDAGVKVEPGYEVYEEGVAKDYFCKNEKGENFIGAVWPGKVHFPDFLQEEVRNWFGQKYQGLIEMGIEGFWNDMNEPAIFYSEEGLKEAFEGIEEVKKIENIGIYDYFHLNDIVGSVSNSPKDYARIQHKVDGKMISHDKVHNLYGYNMTKAAGEAFEKIEPDKRLLLFSRASYIGMHRYGGIWTGDNKSWWSHLLMNIQMMPNLNLCGFVYSGADLGGFGENTSEDLLMRWLEFGVFTPLMRNHAALGTRNQEIYQFKNIESFKKILGIRYGLLPYLYSEYMKAVLGNHLYFRPIGFDYEENEMAWQVEDQLMVGESMMIAPVYKQNATGRYVYLPEDMLMVRMKSMEERQMEKLAKGHHYIEVALDELVFFIKPDHMIPVTKPALCVKELQEDQLELLSYVKKEAHYRLYQDDGFTKDYEAKANYTELTIQKTADGLKVNASQKPERFTVGEWE